MRRMGPRTRASTPSGGDQRVDGRRRHGQPLRSLRRGRPGHRDRAIRTAQPAGAAIGKRGQPSRMNAFRRTLRPATGTPWPNAGRRLFQRRSSSGGECGSSTWSRCRDQEISRSAADLGFTIRDVERHCDPRRAPRPHACPILGQREQPEAFNVDLLNIVEIDADERIVAVVTFDLDDFDAAIAELDARYITGEAAAHAHTWSLVAAGYAGFNRRELFATTPDWVSIDHRRGAAFRPRRHDRLHPSGMGRLA